MMNKFIYKFLKGLVTSMFSGIEGSLSQTYSGVCRILTISRFPQSEISNTEKWGGLTQCTKDFVIIGS